MAEPQISPVAGVTEILRQYLEGRKSAPRLEVLSRMLELIFYSSMKCEEGRQPLCTVMLVDAASPDSKPPQRIRPQRPTFVRFSVPLPFTIRNFVKLSQAIPPWAACLAIGVRGGRLKMMGLFDQEVHYRNSLNQEGGHHFQRAGHFQVEITGVGAFSIYDGTILLATYTHGTVTRYFQDVLFKGPVAIILSRYWRDVEKLAENSIRKESTIEDATLDSGASMDLCVRTLSRILLTMRRSKHGGALLLTQSADTAGLKIKYGVDHSKLHDVLAAHLAHDWLEELAYNIVENDFLLPEKEELPVWLYLDEWVEHNSQRDAVSAELGCVNMIASLAAVDGLVWLSDGFWVRGFGVEITSAEDPPSIHIAGDELATRARQRRASLSDFGTRHRSMMRYCFAHPGSVGFVLSQDGDVRAITRVKDRLVMWENVRLQNFSAPTKPKRELSKKPPRPTRARTTVRGGRCYPST